MEIGEAITWTGLALGYSSLKEEQVLCITKFIKGNDVFCILPTGYGKTACFSCLPGSIDLYYGFSTEERAIIIVKSSNGIDEGSGSEIEEAGR